MKTTLEHQLFDFLEVKYTTLSSSERRFYKVSIEDCLKFTEAAVNAKLQEAAEKISELDDERNIPVSQTIMEAEEIVRCLIPKETTQNNK